MMDSAHAAVEELKDTKRVCVSGGLKSSNHGNHTAHSQMSFGFGSSACSADLHVSDLVSHGLVKYQFKLI